MICILRYWDGSTPAQRGKFEHDLYLQTLPEWGEIKQYSNKEKLGQEQYKSHVALVESVFCLLVIARNKSVVFKKTNDLVFFITGSGYYTEMIRVFDFNSVICSVNCLRSGH